jgi:hypothetical protein
MVGATIAALLVILVALAPTLLFGESASPTSLIVTGASLVALGLVLRWRGGGATPGTIVLVVGVGLLALGVSLGVLALASRGW